MMTRTLLTLAVLLLALFRIEFIGTPAGSLIRSEAKYMSSGGTFRQSSPRAIPYPSVSLEFNGTIDGVPVISKGSIKAIYAQLGLDDPTETAIGFSNESAAVVPREMSDCNCVPVPHNKQWKRAYVFSLEKIIKVMRNWKGDCNIKAQSCMLLNCYYGSAVHACNDEKEDQKLKCNVFADYTQKVRDGCYIAKKGLSGEAGGQLWDTEGWNIYVINEGCGAHQVGPPVLDLAE
ncbi:uncharacterized protein RAG0_00764 [Rhynchosporium agropyri]|uniref:Secreted protein n=1 Tax=Rhynchosporium agropyri TaxID=914238 RepID=A0A1E1JUK5_9HELO|nr:uncharacterized protein RAG0_00764 [Rhynchosporium agropyri]